MKILIDMNLSPDWAARFAESEIESIHWSTVGNPTAADPEIMQYARDHGYVVFTHDLDFGAILATTRATGPSVIQIRTQDIMSERNAHTLIGVLKANESTLDEGALITVDQAKARIRILPLQKSSL